jgi:glyoxylase-like metal-dependent hydrolase (beta-lactamase superfamily II)
MRNSAPRLFLSFAGAGCLWLALTQQPPAAPLTVEKIADDLHVIVGSGGNVAVLTTDEGVILVDDKFDRNVPEILEKVKSVTAQPVRYVLNTHHHGDHAGGNTTLIKSAEIVGHDNAYANMVKGKQAGPPRITFSRESTVRLGGKEVRMVHFGRGHTNGDSFVLFPAHRVLHTGDLFVAGAPFVDYENGGSGLQWPETIGQALSLDFERVIPGHGPISAKADLAKWRDTFEAVRQRVSQWKMGGKSKDEVMAAFKTDDFPAWKPSASAPVAWRSIAGYYDELPGQTASADVNGRWTGTADTIDASGVKRMLPQTLEIKGAGEAMTGLLVSRRGTGGIPLKARQEGDKLTLTGYITFEGGEYLRWYLESKESKLVGRVWALHDSPKKWGVDWSGPVEFTRQ